MNSLSIIRKLNESNNDSELTEKELIKQGSAGNLSRLFKKDLNLKIGKLAKERTYSRAYDDYYATITVVKDGDFVVKPFESFKKYNPDRKGPFIVFCSGWGVKSKIIKYLKSKGLDDTDIQEKSNNTLWLFNN